MKKELIIVIAITLIAAIAAGATTYYYTAPEEAKIGVTALNGMTVVVPRFGSVNCELTGQETIEYEFLLSPVSKTGTTKTSVTCSGMSITEAQALRNDCYIGCTNKCGWDPFGLCINPCTAECDIGYANLIKNRTVSTSGSYKQIPGVQRSFQCTGANCKVYAPEFISMNTGYYTKAFYKIYVNGVETAGHKLTWNDSKFCENKFPLTISFSGSIPVTVQKGDEVTIWAAAYSDRMLIEEGYTNIRAKFGTNKIKLVTYVDGTKVWKENTQGCMDNIILQSVNFPTQPLYKTAFNLFTDDTGQIKSSIPGVTGQLTLPKTLPASMDPGQSYTFIFEWKALNTAYGNVQEYQGMDVWVDKINRVLYKLEEVPTSTTTYAVPTTVVLSYLQCVGNQDCLQTLGPGYYCNENFACTQDPNACFSDVQCATQPVQCQQIGTGYFNIGSKCNQTSKTCEQTTTPVNCCPGLCPTGTVCDIAVGCVPTSCEKITCPINAGCCVETECYYAKNCPTGYECLVSGTAVGQCIKQGYCGDGTCNIELGETAATCAEDCLNPNERCDNIIDDDGDGTINEGCDEICWDGLDNDQDGITDEGCNSPNVWLYTIIAALAAGAIAGGIAYYYYKQKGRL